MEDSQPHITTFDGKRRFACSPVAVLAIIVNEREEILLLSYPERDGGNDFYLATWKVESLMCLASN